MAMESDGSIDDSPLLFEYPDAQIDVENGAAIGRENGIFWGEQNHGHDGVTRWKVIRTILACMVVAAVFVVVFEVYGFKHDVTEWVDSCERIWTVEKPEKSLRCAISSSSYKLWATPLLGTVMLLCLATFSVNLFKVTRYSEYVWCATMGQVAAAISTITLAMGGSVTSIWAPPQHWHDAFDVQSFLIAMSCFAMTIVITYYGFFSIGFCVNLGNMYLNFWHFCVLLTLEWDKIYYNYPRPNVFGVDIFYTHAAALVGGWILASGCYFYFNHDDRAFMLVSMVFDTLLLFLKGVSLVWETAYSSNMSRLIPSMTILNCVFLFAELNMFIHAMVFIETRRRREVVRRLSSVESRDKMLAASEQDGASWLSYYTFWWILPTLKTANEKEKLDEEDLPGLPVDDCSETLLDAFREVWKAHEGKQITGWTILYMTAYSIQKKTFLASLLHGWMFLFLMLLDPLLLNRLLDDDDGTRPIHEGIGLVLILSISMFIRVTCMEVCYFESTRVNNNVRTVLATSIFRKSLRAGDGARYDTGSLTNLMATDADKLGKTSWMVFFIAQWSWAIASLPVVVILMHKTIGNAVYIGMTTILIGGLISRKIGRTEKGFSRRLIEIRDQRSQALKEVLTSINVIKLQVWEDEWRRRVYAIREREMRQLVILRLLQAFNSLIGYLLRVAVPVSIFAWYTVVDGNELDSKTAFTTLAWISQIQWSIDVLPAIYNMYAALSPSCDRIKSFLTNQTDTVHVEQWMEPDCGPSEAMKGSNIMIELTSGSKLGYRPILRFRNNQGTTGDSENLVQGQQAGTNVVLENVGLKVYKGEFVIIVGPVGVGKSTLLSVLAKGIEPLSGACFVNGTRSFVSQKPFLLNDTIQNNILFGKSMDRKVYEQCLKDAALSQDLESMENGDGTVVGENGIQLSGGQKARVAFARALYADADSIFLDDVLSAVDATTGQFIWNNTLVKRLIKKQRKTIVLVTHQLQYLSKPEVSRVVVVKGKSDFLVGSWDSIKGLVDRDMLSYVETSANSSSSNNNNEQQKHEHEDANDKTDTDLDTTALSEMPNLTLKECEERVGTLLLEHAGATINSRVIDEILASLMGRGELLEKEKKREGFIAWRDFKVYLSVFGSRLTLFILAFVLLSNTILPIYMNVWLSIWGDSSHPSDSKYLNIYIVLGVGTSFASSLETIMLTVCALHASRAIHFQMFERLLGAAMSYFDRTPSGQITNRFLQDLVNIDYYVPRAVLDQITKTLNMLTQIGLVLVFAPWIILSLPLIFIPYFAIFGTVRCAARDSRRLEAIAHSPVYTRFSDVLRGQLSIRAYNAERLFEIWNDSLVQEMSRGKYANEAVNKWAQTLTTQNGCVLYLVCGIVSIYLLHDGKMSLGDFGLVMLYSANLQRASMDYMMGLASLESQFVSVERIAQFLRTPNEFEVASAKIEDKQSEEALKDWPGKGEIKFQGVGMRYSFHRRKILNQLSFEIPPGCKVALCGRTGCGKSSTFGVLCRLYPIAEGKIEIDGIDLEQLPLPTVRNAMRVITQDSVLVDGTLRENLLSGADRNVTDEDLWNVLEMVQLKQYITSLPNGLDHEVEDGGKNFSVGQRQLLCTARALLPRDGKPPKILLADEATANIDLQTDKKIHDVILNLEGTTVLMICHRLQHIRNFDHVLVFSPSGSIMEQGPPETLLKDKKSELNRLFQKAGLM